MSDAAPRISFVTLGCKVNQSETDSIAASLGASDAYASPAEADVVVVNTCTVTAEADRKARKAVRRALGQPGSPVVVVTGCLATLDGSRLRALGDRVVVEADKGRVAERVDECLASRGVRARDSAHDVGAAASTAGRVRSRVQLKVEDGCDAFCAYCIVPYARGLPRSIAVAEVVSRAEELVAAGVPEVVLTGINIGRYGDDGVGLPGLIEAVAATGVPRIRLSSIEPGDVTERLLAVAASTPAFCAHLHIPLQSGSDSVLARMGRPYDTTGFATAIGRARRALPGLAVSTDVIAGFPGETEREAEETRAFVESQGFSRLHVFRYSVRVGTPAASMSGQVVPSVRSDRAAALRDLGTRLAAAYATSHIGSVAEVLVERRAPGQLGDLPGVRGTTREYLDVVVASAQAAPGTLLRVVLEVVNPDGGLLGRPAS